MRREEECVGFFFIYTQKTVARGDNPVHSAIMHN